jgi:predicted tellurium resistance membrane protein TerC
MEFVIPNFASFDTWMSLLTLTFLEIVLGIDNIIFISIAANKLPRDQQKKAANIGLLLAMALRILLLFGITILVAMEKPWIEFDNSFIHGGLSGQSIILILGGLFLLYKSTSEIHHKLEGESAHKDDPKSKGMATMQSVILQITVINIVFSFDSILTAVGMTNGVYGALVIMIIAVVLSVLIMMLFAVPVGRFVDEHPTIQMLGLAFLIMIGFMLIVEGAHLGHIVILKGYLYFAIAFSLFVEFLNMRLRKKVEPVQLHGVGERAKADGLMKEGDKIFDGEIM